MHLSLFVGMEGGEGYVYQVQGDATYMHYSFGENIRLFRSTSFHSSYVIAQLGEGGDATVRRCAELEAPPAAADRASVTENCQG